MGLITATYETALAHAYHLIDSRGLLINADKKEKLRQDCTTELQTNCQKLSNIWALNVYIGAENKPKDKASININAKQSLLVRLKDLGYDVPKIRRKNKETHEYESQESTNKLALKQLLANPESWPKNFAGHPDPSAGEAIKLLLDTVEVITFKQRYINAKLYEDQYFSSYGVASTNTGRRSSRKSIFGLGGNAQNFPSRGRLSSVWKECIEARPGKIFVLTDQMQAEDWPVQALAANYNAIDEMRRGVNRHYKFASLIFNTPVDVLKSIRGNHSHTDFLKVDMQYNMGKRGRHANNYGMQPPRLSEILAAEGYSIPATTNRKDYDPITGNPVQLTTSWILERINNADPNIKAVFHQYIKEQLSKPAHSLCTPLGRERQFLGLRSGEKNYNIFNEANAFIPQSTVGDNTGLAVLYLESCRGFLEFGKNNTTQESHDSICQECCDSESELLTVFRDTKEAFKRVIRFHNGIEIEIPIEMKIGYDWFNTVTVNEKAWDLTEENFLKAWKEVKEKYGTRPSN